MYFSMYWKLKFQISAHLKEKSRKIEKIFYGSQMFAENTLWVGPQSDKNHILKAFPNTSLMRGKTHVPSSIKSTKILVYEMYLSILSTVFFSILYPIYSILSFYVLFSCSPNSFVSFSLYFICQIYLRM